MYSQQWGYGFSICLFLRLINAHHQFGSIVPFRKVAIPNVTLFFFGILVGPERLGFREVGCYQFHPIKKQINNTNLKKWIIIVKQGPSPSCI